MDRHPNGGWSRRKFLGAAVLGTGATLLPVRRYGRLAGAAPALRGAAGAVGELGGDGEVFSLSAGAPGVAAVGRSGGGAPAAWLSTDEGAAWEAVPLDGPDGSEAWGVAAVGAGFVAVGSTLLLSTEEADAWDAPGGDRKRTVVKQRRVPAVWTSADGRTWAHQPLDGAVAGNAGLCSVAAGPHGLVAVGGRLDADGAEGEGGLVLVSEDGGRAWSEAALDPVAFDLAEGAVLGVAAQGSSLVAVGGDVAGGRIWSSADGRAWRLLGPASAAFRDVVLRSVAQYEGALVVAGAATGADDRPRYWSSQDAGSTWSERDLGLESLSGPAATVHGVAVLGPSGGVRAPAAGVGRRLVAAGALRGAPHLAERA